MSRVLDPEIWESLESLEAAGTPGFLRELVSEFLTQAPLRMARVKAAAADGDAPALEREAHAFKGSCGSLGAFAMAASCGRLEAMGRDGSCAGHAEVLAALEQHWQAVRAELESALTRLA
jgi:HPt (histidine-containing phosphotransfer) domain-containing protein